MAKDDGLKLELIALAKDKLFHSTFLFNDPYKYSSKEELRWYFWMCELQQWLRDKHNIHIKISCELVVGWYFFSLFEISSKQLLLEETNPGDNYEEALCLGLIESLKTI
jgi:hypothetical protein